jgi:hypothetical protein
MELILSGGVDFSSEPIESDDQVMDPEDHDGLFDD